MKKLLACLLSLALLLAPAVAQAEEEPEAGTGYLIQLDLWARTAPVLDGLLPVNEEQGLYLAPDAETAAAAEEANQVLFVEEDALVELFAPALPPLRKEEQQWGFIEVGGSYARESGLDGSGIRIAIIDSGVNSAHQEFAGVNIARGYDYVEKDTVPQDVVGHGTVVASVIAAEAGIGSIAGLAPGVELVPLKCFEDKTAPLSGVVQAIYDAVDVYDCQIINLSLGVSFQSDILEKAVRYVDSKGVVMVAAVGNKGQTDNTVQYPAGYDCVIGVGAIAENRTLADFSQKNESVHVVAPGVNIRGASRVNNDGYATGSGTSYATPYVTAAVALLKSVAPELDRAEIMERLADTAIDLGDKGWDKKFGYGLVTVPALCEGLLKTGLEVTVDGESLRVTAMVEDLAPVSGVDVVYTVYSKAGRLLSVAQVQATTTSYGRLETVGQLFSTPDAARVQVLLLKPGTLVPLRSPLTHQLDAGL